MTKDYAKITYDGSWLICEIADCKAYLTGLDPFETEVVIVSMTEEEFEQLPEFQGW
jgi:hypothetical protein